MPPVVSSSPKATRAPRHVRVDRRDFASEPHVWLIYASMFSIVGVSSLVIPLLWPSEFDRSRLWPFAVALLVVAVVAATNKPPRLGGKRNFLVILMIPLMSSLGLVAYAPGAAAPAVAAIFAGTFAAGRNVDRRMVTLHLALATLLLLLPVLLADVDRSTLLAVASILPGIWVLGWATTLILEAAEAQSLELASLVRRDPLTGVGNRRLLDETLQAELERHEADGRQLSVLALDLNGFKALNDQVGHDAGDALLRAVAATLAATVGARDTVVRQGGDEFCLLLPDTGPAEAAAVRDAVDSALAAMGAGAAGVSTGTGLATYPVDASTPAALLEVADARLAADKSVRRTTHRALPTGLTVPEVPGVQAGVPEVGSMRVSRRQLAVNLTVWRAQGVLVAFYSLLLGGTALFALEGANQQRIGLAFCVVLGAAAYFTLRREPPAIGTALNHAAIALPYVSGTLFIVSFPEVAAAALGPFALAGSLAAGRLTDRKQIVAHWLAAGACLLALIGSGLLPIPVVIALALLTVVVYGTGGGAMVYLERSEEQGDELERLVRRDPLTGVGNRRLLAEQLDEEIQRATRTSRPVSVLALDLNGFKALNDTLGHAAGDALLRDVAGRLQVAAREDDTVVRQGGDEFCILLPGTGPAEAVPVANAVRAAVAGLSRDGHRITTGVGIATYPADANTGDVLLYVADERLRTDKEAGAPRERRGEERAVQRPSLELLGDPDDAEQG
ncbi:MAG: GGDEF domain-containing protein [Solirubrobacteraceae bacterium]|nr:GGDEF domain-containing protein [Solirubrobacteraceae bacterium]